jgi:flagellin-specific chaperone FliS
LYGRETKEKVERLLALIKKAISSGKIPKNGSYITKIKRIEKALTNYLDSGEIDVTTTELKGLAGIAGCSYYYPRKKK